MYIAQDKRERVPKSGLKANGMRKKIELETIFEASKKVFSEYGFKKATLQDIADELDVTNSNLYIYFDGKKKLYDETLRFYLKKWFDKSFLPLINVRDPRGRLNLLMRNAASFLVEDKRLLQMLKNDAGIIDGLSPAGEFRLLYNDIIGSLSAIVKDGSDLELIRAFDADATAETLFRLYISMRILPLLKGNASDDGVLEDIVKFGLFSSF
ncbi:MAG: TetR/AcrR family transcriptional regulator [Clostridiales bacterium]|nr:TetR/AcrR family transcriptional regulator [Clostridiales bacterium]